LNSFAVRLPALTPEINLGDANEASGRFARSYNEVTVSDACGHHRFGGRRVAEHSSVMSMLLVSAYIAKYSDWLAFRRKTITGMSNARLGFGTTDVPAGGAATSPG
jgi:hypothetical protein